MVQFMSSENNNIRQLLELETESLLGDDILMYLNLSGDDEPIPKRPKSSSSYQTATRFMSSENNNVRQLPEPETESFAGDDLSMYLNHSDDDEPIPKRSKSSSSSQTATQQPMLSNEFQDSLSQYNPLNEPSPLGLRLRKSPSLLELAQKKLNECKSKKGDLPSENREAGTKRDSKARTRVRAASTNDKLKASHFPALLLRVGQWEYVSQYEGDLVAKCYFSKHKIVWEVLDGGLKKKFEINWADIVGLKANYEADGPGTLTIVLDKQPIFFKEINPQPRKHTQWRSASDFTNGEASMNRQHVLQCAHGVLNKHYEKLIQCDARLNLLSQKDIVLNVPYFPPKPCVEDQDISGGFNLQEIYNITHMASASTLPTSSSKTLESSSLSLIQHDMSKEVHSSSSGMSTDLEGQREIAPYFQPTVNNIWNSYPEHVSGNLLSANNVGGEDNRNDVLENISQILLSDNQLTTTSDERILMSKVNSFCNLLQDHQNDQKIGNGNVSFIHDPTKTSLQDVNDSSTLDSVLISKSTTQEAGSICQSTRLSQDYITDHSTPGSSQMVQQYGNENSILESNPTPGNDGNGSFIHDPTITSLQDINDSSTLDSVLISKSTTQEEGSICQSTRLSQDYTNDHSTPGSSQMVQQYGNENSILESNPTPGNDTQHEAISRNDSFSDLVHQLPRIASLPRFLFDISENGEILK